MDKVCGLDVHKDSVFELNSINLSAFVYSDFCVSVF